MIDITIKSLAAEIKITVNNLLQQFSNVGINKTVTDYVTKQEKEILFEYLNKNQFDTTKKFILRRRMHTTLQVASNSGKNKYIQIEIRKKYMYDRKFHEQLKEEDILKKQIQKQDKKILNHLNTYSEIKNEKKQTLKKNIHYNRQAIHKTVNNYNWDTKSKLEYNNNNLNNISEIKSLYNFRAKRKNNLFNKKYSNNLKLLKDKYSNDLLTYKINNTINNTTINHKNKFLSDTKTNNFNKSNKILNRNIIISEQITVAELANKMKIKSSHIIKILMKLDCKININQNIDQEIAQLIAEEMGYKVVLRYSDDLEKAIIQNRNNSYIDAIKLPRPPIVTIMGHVDHGKTSLLDCIRNTKIASKEIGGITQRIGAYQVQFNNCMITFIDTPGHEIFTAMRIHGIEITDIIVLVIAVDDGIMPQTIEAIKHAKIAKVPIIVAINKIDKLTSNISNIKNELMQYGIISEDMGGENQFVNVSAKLGTGIDELLNAILLQAEIMELKSFYKGMASGTIIESCLSKGLGPIATILIRSGTLHRGDIVLCGLEYGKIRAIRNEIGNNVLLAEPSVPVEILGLSGIPIVGDEIIVVQDEKKAKEVSLYRKNKSRDIQSEYQKKTRLENVIHNVKSDKLYVLNIILKSNTQGSIEAIINALKNLSNNKIELKIISYGVGDINETDAHLAVSANAVLLGFNVRANISARNIIKINNLNIRYCSIVYNLINAVKQMINDILMPKYKQEIIGLAKVKDVFRLNKKFGVIAGCIVTSGTIKINNLTRILRNNIIVYENKLESLHHFKNKINEVHSGMECGISIKNYSNYCIGDVIATLENIETKNNI